MNKNTLPAVIITGLALVGVVVCSVTGNTIPEVLSGVALIGAGVVGGQSVPKAAE